MLARTLKVIVGLASAIACGIATVLVILQMWDIVRQGSFSLERFALPILIAVLGIVLLVGGLRFLADGIRGSSAA
jgi:hypothetical protein